MRCVPWTAAALLFVCAGGAAAQQDEPALRRVLVTAGLQQRTVNIVSISEQEVLARDASSGASVRVPLSNVRAILPVMVPLGGIGGAGSRRADSFSGRISSDEPAVLVTVDSQTIPGKPDLGTRVTSPDQLPWVSDVLGTISMPLENIQRLMNRAGVPVREAGTADRVYLRNGDMIEGFVELMPESPGQAVTLSVDAGEDRTSTIEWAGVESVEFAVSPQPPRGQWVWLSDATALSTSALTISAQGQMSVAWPQAKTDATLPPSSLWGFVPSREHMDALAARPMLGATPGGQRRFAQLPRHGSAGVVPLGAQDIEMSGPVAAVWDLGAGALRVSGVIEMAPSDRVWGDCTVTLEDASSGSDSALTAPGSELWTTQINAATPTASFLVELPVMTDPATPRLLRVRIGEGENGPVQDRVWLRRVLIER